MCTSGTCAHTHIHTQTDRHTHKCLTVVLPPQNLSLCCCQIKTWKAGHKAERVAAARAGTQPKPHTILCNPQHLIAKEVGGRAGEGRAYANLGISYQSMGAFSKAIEYHTQCLAIAKEVGDQAGRARHTGTSATRTSLGTLSKAIKYTRSTWRLQRRWTTGRGRATRTRASAIATCT